MEATELNRILELVVNSPIGSYAQSLQHKPLIDKLVGLYNRVAQGARLDALSAKEAALVDAARRGLACISGNTGPAAHADGVVPAGGVPAPEQLAAQEG